MADRDRQSRLSNSGVNRRRFLKGAGAAGVVALAGCGTDEEAAAPDEDGGAQDTPEPAGDGDGDGDQNGDTTDGDTGEVTIEYWNVLNSQSRQAREMSEEFVNQFEDETGYTVEDTYESTAAEVAGSWLTAFRQGNQPVVFDHVTQLNGQYVANDWLVPISEFEDQLDDGIVENIEWMFEGMSSQYSGFGGEIYDIPLGWQIYNPMIVRTNHFEEAGMDPDERLPHESHDELVETCEVIQESGVTDTPFEVTGDAGDILDTSLPRWTVANGGQDGLFLNEDWSDVNFDNDVWKTWTEEWAWMGENFSTDAHPTVNYERTIPKVVQGNVTMVNVDVQAHPDVADQGGELVEDGTIKWFRGYLGPEQQSGLMYPRGMSVTRAPDGADEDEWERKQEAAIEFINFWLSEEVQSQIWEALGLLPAREDMWDDLPTGEAHRALETHLEMAEYADFGWSSHPRMLSIQYNEVAPIFQEILQGNLTPDEGTDQAAETARDLIEEVDI